MGDPIGAIVFPGGAAGNHLRWLLFLDEKFPTTFCGPTVLEKVKFIVHQVYHPQRTWHNWIANEFTWRWELDKFIEVSHNWDYTAHVWESVKLPDLPDKRIYIFPDDIDQCFYHNSMVVPTHFNNYDQTLKRSYDVISSITPDENTLVIPSSPLVAPQINYEYYKKIIDFFGFSDHYEQSLIIQNAYRRCRIKSAAEFYKFFTGEKFIAGLEYFKNFK